MNIGIVGATGKINSGGFYNGEIIIYIHTKRRIFKMEVERYTDKNGNTWVRIKFTDRARTEVILPESEFIKHYGYIN